MYCIITKLQYKYIKHNCCIHFLRTIVNISNFDYLAFKYYITCVDFLGVNLACGNNYNMFTLTVV